MAGNCLLPLLCCCSLRISGVKHTGLCRRAGLRAVGLCLAWWDGDQQWVPAEPLGAQRPAPALLLTLCFPIRTEVPQGAQGL